MNTKWFHYSQNNTGGAFEFDTARGITHHMVIEATDASHADSRAQSLGMYFDGCDDGRDCPCCGDRWGRAYGKGDDAPKVYGRPVDEPEENPMYWVPLGTPEIFVHPIDGPFRGYQVREAT